MSSQLHKQVTKKLNSTAAPHPTPTKSSGYRESSGTSLVSELQREMHVHLSNTISECHCDGKALYPSLNELAAKIARYVETSAFYNTDNKRWNLPKAPKAEKLLYPDFDKIFQDIARFFNFEADSRWIVDTHGKRMNHRTDDTVEYFDHLGRKIALKSSPDFCVLGSGFHFPGERYKRPEMQYAYCVTPIEIKVVKSYNETSTTMQAAVYARQCFEAQDTRERATVIILTEEEARVFLFDRSGAVRMGTIDIHEEPEDFVRIILGAASADADIVGMDPRFAYDKDGKNRTLRLASLLGKNGESQGIATYTIGNTIFHRWSITGRGTVCYDASLKDNSGSGYLIKISWRQDGRIPEHEFYKDATGLEGVGQMIAYDGDNTRTTTAGRALLLNGYPGNVAEDEVSEDEGSGSDSTDDSAESLHSQDEVSGDEASASDCRLDDTVEDKLHVIPAQDDPLRTRTTIVLEKYGDLLEKFESPLQLLEAFHDAVIGHRNLWIKGILHRDISSKNILLGVSEAQEGNRGRLIDLDMALRVHREKNPTKGTRTGTRAYQSYLLLQNIGYPQDHRDDLESFVYVLGTICSRYDGPSNQIKENDLVVRFEDHHDKQSADAKHGFLRYPHRDLTPYFLSRQIFKNLFRGLGNLCVKWIDQKDQAMEDLRQEHAGKDYRDYAPTIAEIHKSDVQSAEEGSVAQDHQQFLAIIDKAIEGQRQIVEAGQDPPNVPATEQSSSRRRKRSPEEGGSTGGSSKRSKKGRSRK